jgi:predicted permease
MTTTIRLIADTILPVFVLAGIGFAFARLVLDRLARANCSQLRGLSSAGLGEHEGSIAVVSGGIREALHTLTFSFAGPAFVFTALRESDVALGALGEPALVAASERLRFFRWRRRTAPTTVCRSSCSPSGMTAS